MKVNDECKGEDKDIPCSITEEITVCAPCSSVYCNISPENTVSTTTLSVLTKDMIRAFLLDYYADYDALRGPQTIDSVWCFGEKYYTPDFHFVRPSGNPLTREQIVTGLYMDMKIISIELISIDSVTLLMSRKAAVVVFTCEHAFEYRGTLSEDRGVVSIILELRGGEIKIVHEHRSSGSSIPKETRWKSD